MKLFVYDLETYPNCFLFTGKFVGEPRIYIHEISSRTNERDELMRLLSYLQNYPELYMVGYNSLGFDYPILHELLTNQYTFDAAKAHHLGSEIVKQTYGLNPHMIPQKERIIPQIDLVKINHFDNNAKRTSLKSLQFAMRSHSVEDLPFPLRDLTHAEMDILRQYNIHDVTETEKFAVKCSHLIEMRKDLLMNGTLTGDVLNFSDVKIGTEYLIKKIGRHKCMQGSKPKQTIRSKIEFNKIILPKIEYRTGEFNAVLEWFRSQSFYMAGDERPKLQTKLAGLEFFFGVGGVHASVENCTFHSSDTHSIWDIDVAGMYVAVAIANGFYPEHLGQDFTHAYKQLQADRRQYPKGSTMNAVLKLAGNGVYGNSNNPYSPFYDPQYTFSVTINGQLQLLQLVERLSLISGVELIQANTDGITALVPNEVRGFFDIWCRDWESHTGLKLEEVQYSSMHIRDVNNYVAVTTDGKIKRKGAYWYPTKDSEYEGWWNKDFSNMAAQKGVEQLLLHPHWRAQDLVRCLHDPFDFMLRYKTPAGATVFIGDKEMPKTVRYYVSVSGQPMRKVASPKGIVGSYKRKNKITDAFYMQVRREVGDAWDERIHTKNKSKYETVVTSIESGRKVKNCNVATDFNWDDVDWDYYAKEIEKLRIGK